MTIKEAVLKSLEELKKLSTHTEVYNHLTQNEYYEFTKGKTPKSTISAELGNLIRSGDSRIKRIKGNGNFYLYYHTKNEQFIDIETTVEDNTSKPTVSKKENVKYHERDLHKLLSSYLNSKNIHSKTILHEISKNNNDNHQKWIHPDMIGIEFCDSYLTEDSEVEKYCKSKNIPISLD